MRTSVDHHVVVAGDGPAGRAIAAALRRRRVDVVCVGRDEPWLATYGTWVDDVRNLPGLPDVTDCLAAVSAADVFTAHAGRQPTGRLYGAFDNARLRDRLSGADAFVAHILDVRPSGVQGADVVTDRGSLAAHLVVDARGWPRESETDPTIAQQTAYGVVLGQRPDVGGDGNVVMDWRPAGSLASRDGHPPTFLYVLDLGAGRWLAEETALAVAPPLGADILRRRLVERLGEDVVAGASAVEQVRIPMRAGLPVPLGPVVPFGARAGYVHPATGYSVAASLRAADRVAEAIADVVSTRAVASTSGSSMERVWQAVWPRPARRTRALHDVGSSLLANLDPREQDAFFARFFALEERRWSAYLRIDAAPGDVASAMWRVFRASPWSVRRELVAAVPRALRRRMRRADG